MKLRLDKLLLERGIAETRERAQALILAGRVLVNEQKVDKCGAATDTAAEIRVLGGDELRYVSRGGLKLEHALAHWKIELTGRVCLDVGTSTGGFVDCMLQHGAARVVAVDTGRGQIAAKLRSDPRVMLVEECNARYLRREDVAIAGAAGVTFAAIDVSFISATLIFPAVHKVIRETLRESVVLVKPQFEAGREHVEKGGIVRDAEAQRGAVERVRECVRGAGAQSIDVIDSPILGREGNREFLLYASFVAGQPER